MLSRTLRLVTAAAALLGIFAASTVHAQGVTDAAIEGATCATDSAGAPVAAQVLIVNSRTGAQLELRSDAGGRFVAEHLSPGGPYRVEARAAGLSAARDGIMLVLGQRYSLTLVLSPDTAKLTWVVGEAQSPVLAQSAMGASHTGGCAARRKRPCVGPDVVNAGCGVFPAHV